MSKDKEPKIFSRRDFLKLVMGGVFGSLSAACQRTEKIFETSTPEEPTSQPSPLPTEIPPASTETSTKTPTLTSTPAPTVTLTPSCTELPTLTSTSIPTEITLPTETPTQEPSFTPEMVPAEPTPIPEVTKPMSFEVNFDPEVSVEIREKVFLTEAGETQLKEAFYHALSGPFFQGRYGQTPEEVAAFLENNGWIIKDFRYPINAGKGAWGETTVSQPKELDLRKGIILNFIAHAPEHETGIGLYQTGGRGIGFEIGVTDEGRLFITVYNPFLTDEGLRDVAGYGYEVPEHEVVRMEGETWATLNILANHDENSLEASPDPDRYLSAQDIDRVVTNAHRIAQGWKPAYSGPEVEKTMAILKERRGDQWENGLMLIPYSLIEGVFSISP